MLEDSKTSVFTVFGKIQSLFTSAHGVLSCLDVDGSSGPSSGLKLTWLFWPVVLFCSVHCLWQYYNLRHCNGLPDTVLPPGNFGWPVIGETLEFLYDGRRFFQHRRAAYGNVFKTNLLLQPMVIVTGGKGVRQILKGENEIVTHQVPSSARRLLGTGGLTTTHGVEHRRLRKLLRLSFSQETMQSFAIKMQSILHEITSQRWCEMGNIMGTIEIKRMAFLVSSRLLLGFDFSDKDIDSIMTIFNEFNDGFFSFPFNLPGTTFRKALKARTKLLNIIGDRISTRAPGSLLGQLLADSDWTDTDTLKNMCLELLFGGHETTASASCALVIHLSQNEHVLQKIEAELEEQLLMSKRGCETLTYEDVVSLSYVNDVVKELLRIEPPVAGAFREVIRTFDIENYTIPAGWSLLYGIRDTHEKCPSFNPDRWRTNTNRNHNSCAPSSDPVSGNNAYIPFGGGPRICAGREFAKLFLKIFTVELVKHCRWTLPSGPPVMKTAPIPFPRDNLPLMIVKNHKASLN